MFTSQSCPHDSINMCCIGKITLWCNINDSAVFPNAPLIDCFILCSFCFSSSISCRAKCVIGCERLNVRSTDRHLGQCFLCSLLDHELNEQLVQCSFITRSLCSQAFLNPINALRLNHLQGKSVKYPFRFNVEQIFIRDLANRLLTFSPTLLDDN